MFVYRIENDDGVGFVFGKMSYKFPYHLEYVDDYVIDKNGLKTERLQNPDTDIGTPLCKAFFDKKIFKGSPLIFGFASVKDLYTWTSPVMIGICELSGYFINVYDIPEEHIIFGTRQVAFNPIHSINKIKISHKKLRNGFK
jgi:hypothetical protein